MTTLALSKSKHKIQTNFLKVINSRESILLRAESLEAEHIPEPRYKQKEREIQGTMQEAFGESSPAQLRKRYTSSDFGYIRGSVEEERRRGLLFKPLRFS